MPSAGLRLAFQLVPVALSNLAVGALSSASPSGGYRDADRQAEQNYRRQLTKYTSLGCVRNRATPDDRHAAGRDHRNRCQENGGAEGSHS